MKAGYAAHGGYELVPADPPAVAGEPECKADPCDRTPRPSPPAADERPYRFVPAHPLEAMSRAGAARGKGDYHEIPPLGIAAVARRLEFGRAKHGGGRAYLRDRVPLSVVADKLLRHAFQALAGEAGEDHLAAVAVNALVLLEIRERIRRGELPAELDDLGLTGDAGTTLRP